MGKGDDPNRRAAAPMRASGLSRDVRRALTDAACARDLLLSRDDFRDAVLERDAHRCVICGRDDAQVSLDAHHLMERRLFGDDDPRPGGYVLANGVTLCDVPQPDGSPSCHRRAEMTLLSVDELRDAAGIRETVLPAHLEAGERYEKWGGVVLSSGRRYRGELFWEEPVQKILAEAGVLNLYLPSVKYPRTPHLWFSPGATPDDIKTADTGMFDGQEVVILEKVDGEQATLAADIYHARSLDSGYHSGRTWVKRLWSQIRWDLGDLRLVGENMQARHSVAYEKLPGYFLLFGIFDARNRALPWDEVEEWAALLELPTVPVLYRGPWDEELARNLFPFASAFGADRAEGFVVRNASGFDFKDFRRSVAKYVDGSFTAGIGDEHWVTRQLVENGLASSR